MTWTRAHIAIAAGVGVLLAATVITMMVKRNEARNAWEARPKDPWGFVATLKHAPAQVRIMPTKFNGTTSFRGSSGGKVMGFDVSFVGMVQEAYTARSERGWDDARTIVSGDVPEGHYDYIANLRDGSGLALQKEIKQKFGIIGKRETRDEDVLLLTMKIPNRPGLKRHGDGSLKTSPDQERSFRNSDMPELARELEQTLNVPVIDTTGLTGKYDFNMDWQSDNPSALKQSLLDALGLELSSTNMPIEMLIVQRGEN